MSTEQTKHWKRWTQTSQNKFFPKKKYGFSTHLVHIGDSVTTYPMEYADYIRIKDAAKFWAWYHDKRVKTEKLYVDGTKCRVRITLISHHREDV